MRRDDGDRNGQTGLADLGLGVKIPLAEEDGWLPNASLVTSVTLGTGNAATRTGNHAVPTQILAWSHSIGGRGGVGGNVVWSLPYADELPSLHLSICLGPWHPDNRPTAASEVTRKCHPCARTRVSPMYPDWTTNGSSNPT